MNNIQKKRLENDFKELSELQDNSGGSLAIASTKGTPPNQYVIKYRCRGIERLQGNEPVFRTTHSVEINCGFNYPREKPSAKFITPVFHPNVYASRDVCLGSYWTMAETVSELVLRIGKLIQYSTEVLNLESPANASAAIWAIANRFRFPVDTQTFKGAENPFDGIVWNPEPAEGKKLDGLFFRDL